MFRSAQRNIITVARATEVSARERSQRQVLFGAKRLGKFKKLCLMAGSHNLLQCGFRQFQIRIVRAVISAMALRDWLSAVP